MTGNLSASILARLLALAKQRGDDYNLLLNRFGMERLLARVSTSPHADRFLLKGALLVAGCRNPRKCGCQHALLLSGLSISVRDSATTA